MIAPITKWKMPSVRQVIGAEMSSMIGLMNALTIPRTRPVRSSEMYLSASPKPYDAFPQVMPGTKKAAIAIAMALISARQMIRMAVETRRATSRLPVRSGRYAPRGPCPCISLERVSWRSQRLIESILGEHPAAAHGLLRPSEDPAAERVRHESEPDQHEILERRIEQRSGAERLHAQDIDRVGCRQRERDRLQHPWQKRHRKRRAREHAEEKVRGVHEEVRLADEQDDPGEQICDADHRQDRAHNGGQRQEHLQP